MILQLTKDDGLRIWVNFDYVKHFYRANDDVFTTVWMNGTEKSRYLLVKEAPEDIAASLTE